MKKLLFLDTTYISNEELEIFILTISAFKDIKCDLSRFDVERTRLRLPLLIVLCPNKISSTSLYSYDSLANLQKEGYIAESAKDLEDMALKLAGDYKYC